METSYRGVCRMVAMGTIYRGVCRLVAIETIYRGVCRLVAMETSYSLTHCLYSYKHLALWLCWILLVTFCVCPSVCQSMCVCVLYLSACAVPNQVQECGQESAPSSPVRTGGLRLPTDECHTEGPVLCHQVHWGMGGGGCGGMERVKHTFLWVVWYNQLHTCTASEWKLPFLYCDRSDDVGRTVHSLGEFQLVCT